MQTITDNKEKLTINMASLYNEQHRKLKNFISKKVWNEEDAEDILQTTFMEAIRCQNKFEGQSKPETWLFGIAVNLMRNYFKRHYSNSNLDMMTDEILLTLESDSEIDPLIQLEQNINLDKALNAIDDMPSDVQSIFHLIIEEESSYQEAADQIGVPIGTIRSRLSRARTKIKECIGL